VLDTRELSPIELVDTVDWLIAASAARGAPDNPDLLAASGPLTVAGRTRTISMWRYESAERHPAETLLRGVYDAPWHDGER
jgi:hypothetical protein